MNMKHRVVCIGIILTVALLAGCSPKNTVVLVPDQNGSVGAITVSNSAGAVHIASPNQYTEIKDQHSLPSAPENLDHQTIQKIFGEVLANEPPQPVHFILYFKSNSVELLPESEILLSDIITAIGQHAARHVSVVGHTDTLGDKTYNLQLSRQRAEAVKNRLVAGGVAEEILEVTSHGEENPVIKTADNVGNAQNRRVEVVVR
jgi:outer membrane protein OmpA-like peptidoglycan-associated protein